MAGFIQANDLERVANMLSENYGIKVVCRGTKCHTEGRTITLPSLPADRVDPKVMSLIRYFLDHEVGHIVGKSDFTLKKKLEATHGKGAGEVLGALEDVRVERLMAAAYAGCGLNLSDGGELVRAKQEEIMASTDPAHAEQQKQLMHPVKQILSTIYLTGRGEDPMSFTSEEVLKIVEPFADEISTIPQWAKSTADLLPLADKVILAYKQSAANQGNMDGDPNDDHAIQGDQPGKGGKGAKGKGSSGSGGGGSGGEGAGGNGQGSSQPQVSSSAEEEDEEKDDELDEDQDSESDEVDDDDETDDESGAGSDSPESGSDDEAGSASGDADEPSDGEPALSAVPESSEEGGSGSGGRGGGTGSVDTQTLFEKALDFDDASEAINNAIATTVGEIALEDPLSMIRPISRSIDRIRDVPMAKDMPQSFVDQCRGAGGSMRQKLAQLLMSEAGIVHLGGLRRGKPDARSLTRLLAGSRNVFKRRVEVPAPDTACGLLIDCSGSMNGDRIYQATMAAAAFAHVLDQCHHAAMIAGFDDDSDRATRNYYTPEECNDPGIRTQGVTLWKAKGWNEPFRDVMPKMYSLMKSGGGGTPLAEAMHLMAGELNKRTEKRKVMICFTDGGPGFYGSIAAGSEENLPDDLDEQGNVIWEKRSQPVWEYEADGSIKLQPNGGNVYKKDAKGNAVYEVVDKKLKMDPASAYVRKIAMECEKSGIETVIIGIGTDCVKRLHKRYAVVNNLAELGSVTMQQLAKVLHAGHHV